MHKVPEGYKRCSRGDQCVHPDGPILPATVEYFSRDAGRASGLHPPCKTCRRFCKTGKMPIYLPDGYRRCSQGDKCIHPEGPALPATADYFYPNGKKLRSMCKLCQSQHSRRINLTPDQLAKRREHDRKYQQKPERKAADHERWLRRKGTAERKAYEKKRGQSPARRLYMREVDKKRRTTPERKNTLRVVKLNRRGANSGTTKLSREDWEYALEYFGQRCAVCGNPPGLWHTLGGDHWIPVSKGGLTIPTNIVPLCNTQKGVPAGVPCCNQSKSDKLPNEWLIERFGKRKANEILKRVNTYFESVRKRKRQDT